MIAADGSACACEFYEAEAGSVEAIDDFSDAED
jgi:hypothetical protein